MPLNGKLAADPCTLAEPFGPGRARSVHLDLDLTVDFVGRRLLGHVDHHCVRGEEPPPAGTDWQLVLDASADLVVTQVQVDGVVLAPGRWSRDEARRHDVLGLAVRVFLPAGGPGEKAVVRLVFETAAPSESGEGGSTALQWLTPEQTAGKRFPYMFSQCQAIHARAMLPCQDTCECKVTYSASVRCPAELTALMSAVKTAGPTPCEEAEWETPAGCGKAWARHTFEQKVPIPAYLIAIVCAALESRRVGPRTQVWSEAQMVEESAWEFEDTEKIVAAGEALCGPYKWGVYDILVLPPSFPYGGMENPCLTFVTPTLLAKDRSQVHVIAHEVTHSWSGNLVTNETWEHFWLNEGLTRFVELKIIRDLYGAEEYALQLASAIKDLQEALTKFAPEDTENFTRLVPDLSGGRDPDDAFSAVPYDKGMSLFCLLETSVGGERHFQPFLKSYFAHFGGKTVTSESMRDYFLDYFQKKAADDPELKAAIAKLDWERLFRGSGMPDWVPTPDPAPLEAAQALARRWAAAGAGGPAALQAFKAEDIKGWGTSKIIVLLDTLSSLVEDGSGKLSAEACSRMAELYGFLKANCEVRYRYLRLALNAKWEGAQDAAVDLATSQGRMKFTRPIFRALKEYNPALAREAFLKHRASYHPICSKMLARDLQV